MLSIKPLFNNAQFSLNPDIPVCPFNGASKAEITEELDRMTKEGREKYNPFN